MEERKKRKLVKVIDPYSGFFKRLGVITECRGISYSVDMLTGSDDRPDQRQPVTLERDQFEYIRKNWLCETRTDE